VEEFDHGFNLCNSFGFESIALIPITIDQSISGLIHVADRRENMFPLRIVEVLEQVAMRLGLALQRFRMQERLSEAVHDQRELSLHLLKAKEEEQRRIALELHDQTGQDLNVLKLRLKEIERRLRKDQEAVKKLCAKTQLFTDHIIENVRRMIHGLNPSTLEALGLVAALNQMVREFSKHSEMRIETHLEPLGDIKNREEQVGLFRIVQEALNNAFKHAEADFVAIRSSRTEKGLQLYIEDNGRGFDPHSKSEAKGMGLAAMKLRTAMIGAWLSVQSQLGTGTRITISLPMERS
jgi:signal transduction histidine kinase